MHIVLPFSRFSALGVCRFTILACPPVCHFSHNPIDLSYPTGSAFPGGMGYYSRRCIIVGRNPDGFVLSQREGGGHF